MLYYRLQIATGVNNPYDTNTIVVLKASATKFNELQKELVEYCVHIFVQKDLGLTEVDAGTETVFGFVEEL